MDAHGSLRRDSWTKHGDGCPREPWALGTIFEGQPPNEQSGQANGVGRRKSPESSSVLGGHRSATGPPPAVSSFRVVCAFGAA
eukprot:CAMPEP_0182814876 /NCGR_PEP_ID=MMETSP0006_2-20121128/10090_1 /TAXON_ID=97485 /ORGANISM="Prymnesium parvum, Strain Texoma1" /LENGTH=82 /DNA_ID=CAMNT_0024941035 /DNA_START=194 /DNA_END=442 /DNA_ORIENTATION=-